MFLITSLLINDVEYKQLILDGETNVLTIQAEVDINSPTSSNYEVVLHNESELEDVLLDESGFPDVVEPEVKLYNDNILVFQGRLDRESSIIDPREKYLLLSFNGKEQELASLLSGYDISQIYYVINETYPVRQRNGRTSATERLIFNKDGYNRIDNMVGEMFKDIGLTNYYINFYGDDFLKFKYNQSRYGNIATQSAIAKMRNTSSNRGLIETYAGKILESKIVTDLNSDSYNTFIKEFAAITGCIYVYDYETGSMCFWRRDYDFTTAIESFESRLILSPPILDESMPINCLRMYDGLVMNFRNIRLAVRMKEANTNPLGLTYDDYDFGAEKISFNFSVTESDGIYYLIDNDGDLEWEFGSVNIHYYLEIKNPLVLNFDHNLQDYLEQNSLGTQPSITELLKTVISNYQPWMLHNREREIVLDGIYVAPLRVNVGGARNVYYSEIDFNTETTKIRFSYSDL